MAYAFGLMLLALVAYLVQDWRYFAFITSAPFLLLFFVWNIMPESPRWLLATDRISELEDVLEKIAKVNNKKLCKNYIPLLRNKVDNEANISQSNQSYGIKSLFKYPNLRWKTIIITFIWFINLAAYVGLSYYATDLGGNEYLNFFLSGAVEVPAFLVLWPTMEVWGRRWNVCLTMVIGGLACLATYLVKNRKFNFQF